MVQSALASDLPLPKRYGAEWVRLVCLSLMAFGVMLLSGCGASPSNSPSPKTVLAISVTPGSPSVAIGATQQMAATANYSDGTTGDVTTQATWTSSSTAVATVSATGLVTGVSAGNATVTATVNGISGSSQATVPAPVKTVTSLAVSPSSVTVAVGATQQLTATATYSDGSTSPVSTAATWTSSNAALATVNASGLVTATGAGSVTITATFSGASSMAQISVPQPAKTLSSIAISPATATVAIGATQQLSATATYSDGSTASVTQTVSWSSSNSAFATVNTSGVVTGVATGTATVTASLSSVSAMAQITVPAPVKTLTAVGVTPVTANIAIGATQQFTATANYSDGSTANVSTQATWTSSNASFASVNASGLVSGVAAGTATISASLNGVSGSAQVTVPQSAKTLTSVGVTPMSANLAIGAMQQFTATAKYSDGSTANVTTQATWTSSNASFASVNASGVATGVAAGTVTISATFNAMTGSAQVTVPQPAKTLSSIAVTPPSANVAVAATQQLTATATYSDQSTANVTTQVTWASSNSGFASVNASGLVTGVAAGSATVSATLNGVSGASQITVPQPKTLSSIAVTPTNPSIVAGATQQFVATATYSDNSTAVVTSTVAWSSSNQTAATINASGLANALSAGSSSITATLSGVTGSTTLTVTPKTISSIAVTPANPSIVAGATQQFVATATYSDNSTAVVTSTVAWSSSNQTATTINSSGLASALTAGSSSIGATLSGVTGSTTLTVTPKTISSIAITPNPGTVALGSTQQLTATATYQDGTTANISSTVNWSVANGAVATVSSSGLATPVASGSTTITASLNNVSATDAFKVTIAPGSGVNVSTWQGDVSRSGLNAGETSLTPTNVSAANFGKLFSYALDGYAYAEPLLMSNVTINSTAHNVLYVATEHDTVYAFDADNYGTGAPLWQTSLLKAGETPMTTGPIKPYQGVTSTPVIDPTTNTIYVVSAQVVEPGGTPTFRLNALDIKTGAHKFGSPVTIQASVPGTNSDSVNGTVSLTTSCVQRSALLLENGAVYIGFGGCHSGWLLSYNASSLSQVAVFNASPNQNGEGMYASAGGIWMGGGGPVADSAGNIYVVTGNGPFDGMTSWGDSVLKFNTQLQVVDYFTPYDFPYMNCQDADMAAGGMILIPGTNQLLAGGKTGKMYSVNSTNMGKEQANDAGVTQSLYFESDKVGPYSNSCTDASGTHFSMINAYEIFGTSAYYNQSVYLGITPTGTNVPSGVRQFTYSGGVLTPSTQAAAGIPESSYGTTPFISASSATTGGVLWMIDHGVPLQSGTPTGAILRAYDASNLGNELYNSSTNTGDAPGWGIKFTSPIAANGKVYMSSGHDLTTVQNPQGEIDVYGLK